MKDSKGKKDSKTGYAKAGLPGIGAKMKEKVKELAEEQGLVFDGVWVFTAHALLKPHHQSCFVTSTLPFHKIFNFTQETGGSTKEVAHAARMPGMTSGVPSWIEKEVAAPWICWVGEGNQMQPGGGW